MPTADPTAVPTLAPTAEPTPTPTEVPTPAPTGAPGEICVLWNANNECDHWEPSPVPNTATPDPPPTSEPTPEPTIDPAGPDVGAADTAVSDAENAFGTSNAWLASHDISAGALDAELLRRLHDKDQYPDNGNLAKAPVIAAVTANQNQANTAKKQQNSPEIGDPVIIATGAFTTSARDLAYSFGRLNAAVERHYTSACATGKSFGDLWAFNYDTRIIRGAKPKAAEERLALETYYNDYHALYSQIYENYYTNIEPNLAMYVQTKQLVDIALQKLTTAQGLYSIAYGKVTLYQLWGYYGSDLLGYKTRLDLLELKRAEYTKISEDIQTVIDTPVKLFELDGKVTEFRKLWKQSVEEEGLSALNVERNIHVLDDPSVNPLGNTGIGTLTLVDEQGTPRMYTLAATPNYDSTAVYADGSKNYYPNGSDTASVPKENDSVKLLPDGSFTRTAKNRTVFVYDFYGQLQSITDVNGNRLDFTYSTNRELTGFADNVGRSTTIARTGGKIDSITYRSELPEPLERTYSYTYDQAGLLETVTNPENETTTYKYEGNDITRITGNDGSFTAYHYLNGKVDTVTDQEGKVDTYAYFPDLGYSEYTNASGVKERYYFDDKLNTTRIEHADGSSAYMTYDPVTNNMITYKDEDGRTTEYGYDANRNLTRILHPNGKAETRFYDEENKLRTSTDRMNNTTVYNYDADGNLERIDFPDLTNIRMLYYDNGSLHFSYDQAGNPTEYTYDTYGNVETITYPDLSTQSFVSDSLGNVLSVTDQEGYTTGFEYYKNNKLKTETNPLGHTVSYVYWPSGDLRTKTDDRGNVTAYEYDRRHNLTKVTNAEGETIEYGYRDDGKLAGKILNGYAHYAYEYDTRGFLYTETCLETDTTTTYEYYYSGKIRATTDPEGNRTSYDYNPGGLVSDIRNADASMRHYLYDDNGRLDTQTDETGIRTYYHYDTMGRTDWVKDNDGKYTIYGYDTRGNMDSVTDRNDNTTAYEYDKMNRLWHLTDPYEKTATYLYWPRGMLKTKIDKLGRTSAIDYDELGRPIETTDPIGKTRTFAYDYTLNTTTVTNEWGYQTVNAYDKVNRVKTVTEPSSVEGTQRTTSYTYGPLGNVRTVTDPLDNVTTYEYDALGRVDFVKDPLDAVTDYAYGKNERNGKRVQVTDAEGRVTTLDYNSVGRLYAQTNSAGETVGYDYDDAGRLEKKTTPKGPTYEYEYDTVGRLWKEKDPVALQKTYLYYPNGELFTTTDAENRVIEYAYDKLGRMTTKTTPEETTSYTYDDVGNLKTVINPDFILQYKYDSLDRLEHSFDWKKTEHTVYAYDPLANIVRESTIFNGGTPRVTTRTYGPDNSLATLTDPDGFAVTYGYDIAGRLTSETKTNDTRTDYTYTPTSLIETIKHTNTRTGEVQKAFAYVYDKTGKRTYQAEETGDVTAYEYDTAGRLAKIDYPFANGQALTAFEERLNAGYYYANRQTNADDYTFNVTDPAFTQLDTQKLRDVLASKNDIMRNAFGIPGEETVKWQVDIGDGALPLAPTVQIDSDPALKLSQMLVNMGIANPLQSGRQVWRELIAYDDNGNKLASANGWGIIDYVYDQRDRLTSAGNRTYGYDDNGNTTSEAIAGAIATYDYDSENRLTESYADTAGVRGMYPFSVKGGTQYTYDPFGREATRADYTIENGIIPGSERFNIYNGTGMDVALELHEPAGQKQPLTEYTYAGSQLVSRKDFVTGDRRFYAQDVLGSTVAITNGIGNMLAKYDYSAYGTPRGTAFLGVEERLYAGKPLDYSAGMYNFGFRRYDPVSARFITLDPIKDGLNWYAYCAGDPINSVDLWGLCKAGRIPLPPDRDYDDSVITAYGGREGSAAWDYFNENVWERVDGYKYENGHHDGLYQNWFENTYGKTEWRKAVTSADPQALLDIAGCAPGVGEIADGVNAAIYLAKGDLTNAGLSAISIAPLVGDVIGKGAKVAKTVEKIIDKGEDVASVILKKTDFPETAQHVLDAQAAGKSNILTIDRAGTAGRRSEALKGIDKVPGKQLDEYPPAMFLEGGTGASVRPISPSDNMGAGASIGNQLRKYPDGTVINLIVE